MTQPYLNMIAVVYVVEIIPNVAIVVAVHFMKIVQMIVPLI